MADNQATLPKIFLRFSASAVQTYHREQRRQRRAVRSRYFLRSDACRRAHRHEQRLWEESQAARPRLFLRFPTRIIRAYREEQRRREEEEAEENSR